MTEQDEALDYLHREQDKNLLAMDQNLQTLETNRTLMISQGAAHSAVQAARVQVRLRLSGCVVALTVLLWGAAIFFAVKYG